jgi:histidinol-phosphate aminotransferase
MPTATSEKLNPNINSLLRSHISKLRPYVPGKPITEVKRELGLPDDFAIDKLASNENVLGPAPAALEAVKNAAGSVWLYPDDTCYDLKNALAEFWNLAPENFIIGNGSDEIIHFLMLALLDAEDEIVSAQPSFVQYESAARLAGCTCKLIPLTSDGRHDLPAMSAEITDRTKMVFIANPNNPSGTVVGKAEFDEFIKSIPQDILVVLDQAYNEYVETDDSPDGIDYVRDGYNVILLHTFSKAYALAGLRVGYGLANAALIKALHQVRGPFNVSSVAQAAAIASLGDADQLPRTRELNSAGKKYFYAQLDEMGLEYYPTEANFILLDAGLPAKEVFQELLRHGVIVRTGDPFGLPTWLRVTIGTQAMNERFIKALRVIRERA